MRQKRFINGSGIVIEPTGDTQVNLNVGGINTKAGSLRNDGLKFGKPVLIIFVFNCQSLQRSKDFIITAANFDKLQQFPIGFFRQSHILQFAQKAASGIF